MIGSWAPVRPLLAPATVPDSTSQCQKSHSSPRGTARHCLLGCSPRLRQCRRQLDRPRARLRPRSRHELLRLLRLRHPRLGLPEDPPPLLPGHPSSGHPKPHIVRVLLTSPGDATSPAPRACGVKLNPKRTYWRGSATVVLADPAARGSPTAARRLRTANAGKVDFNGLGRYRGGSRPCRPKRRRLAQRRQRGGRQRYVKGVIPNEASLLADGGPEGAGGRRAVLRPDRRRRRQRLRPLQRHPQPGLQGLESETPRPTRPPKRPAARSSLRGQGRRDVFSACSGGHTESIQNVFGGAIPYLQGVQTPTTTTARCTPGRSSSAARRSAPGSLGLPRRQAEAGVVTKRGVSPRIVGAKLSAPAA